MREIGKRQGQETFEYKTRLTELKSLICNKKERKICCESKEQELSSPSYVPNIDNGECGLMEDAVAKRQRSGRIVGKKSNRKKSLLLHASSCNALKPDLRLT